MSKVTFDGENRIITVNSGETVLSVKNDVYSEWKRWFQLGTNSKFPIAMRTVGGDAISASKDLGSTFFLTNGWRIRPDEANHRLTINGNLFTDPAGDSPIISTIGSFSVIVEMNVSNLSDSTVQQLPEIEYGSFEGGVTVDVVSGGSGTAFPIGTPFAPVDNLTDAHTIANNRGFKTIHVVGDLDVNTGLDYSRFTFSGESRVNNSITVMSSANTTNAVFRNLTITGELDGGNYISDCEIENLLYVNGYIHESSLTGTIYLGGNTNAVIDHCIVTDPTNTPIVDMGGSGQNLAMPNYAGKIIIKNLTGDNYAGIGLAAGRVIIDSTTVTSGTIHISASGEIVDENGSYITSGVWNGGVTIINEAISTTSISNSVWDVDVTNHNDAGSTGAALSEAQSAGNPWSAVVSENTGPGTFGELIGKKLLTVAKFLGLK